MIDIRELEARLDRASRAIDGVKALLAREALAASTDCGNADLRAKLTEAATREAELEYALADAGAARP